MPKSKKAKKPEPLVLPTYMFDSTMLGDYDRCMRYGYFRHDLKLVREGMALKPGYGICLHSALDVVWITLAGKKQLIKDADIAKVVKEAMVAFMHTWEEIGMPALETLNDVLETEYRGKPKRQTREEYLSPYVPKIAERILFDYIKTRASFLSKIELISAEAPFVVPLYPDSTDIGYMGLIDKVFIHWSEGRIVADHKSTGSYAKDSGFRLDFMEQFNPNAQGTGYIYADTFMRGDKKVTDTAWFDALLVHKERSHFQFFPQRVPGDVIDQWLLDARFKVEHILRQRELVAEGKHAFPMNTRACTGRGICPYKEICTSCPFWQDPGIPDGFELSDWSPIKALKGDTDAD